MAELISDKTEIQNDPTRSKQFAHMMFTLQQYAGNVVTLPSSGELFDMFCKVRPINTVWSLDFMLIFYYLCFTASQDYFTHFEPSQGGAKTGDPREKPPDYPQAELGLSRVTRARLEPTAVRWRAI